MYAIIVTVCSILHGATCKEAELVFADEGQSRTPYACLIGGMMEVSKWQVEHPNWRVASWKCGRAGVYARA